MKLKDENCWVYASEKVDMPRREFGVLGIASISVLLLPRAVAATQLCRFGIFPYVPALRVEPLFAPLAKGFADGLGMPVQLGTKTTFETFRAALAERYYDLALLHPFFMKESIEREDYLPLVRVQGEFHGVLVGCRTGQIQNFASLRGLTLALPPELAGVSYLAREELFSAGLTPGRDVAIKHFRTKISCLNAVASGDAHGCVVPSFMLRQLKSIQEMGLVPLARTRDIVGLAIAISKDFDAQPHDQIRDFLLTWSLTEDGQSALETLSWPGLVETSYDEFKALQIEPNSPRHFSYL